MKEKKIIENNKLIAEFMEFSYISFEVLDTHGFIEKITEVGSYIVTNTRCLSEDLKFHKSYDWLIPVVERIEDYLNGSEIPNYKDSKGYNYWMDKFRHNFWTINYLYKDVVKFIKWYNKNKE